MNSFYAQVSRGSPQVHHATCQTFSLQKERMAWPWWKERSAHHLHHSSDFSLTSYWPALCHSTILPVNLCASGSTATHRNRTQCRKIGRDDILMTLAGAHSLFTIDL